MCCTCTKDVWGTLRIVKPDLAQNRLCLAIWLPSKRCSRGEGMGEKRERRGLTNMSEV